jgi:hypothetical protein
MVRGRVTVQLTVGRQEMTVFGVKKVMDTSPILRYGRTLVPIRYVAEALGAEVPWEGVDRTVHINIDNSESYRIGIVNLEVQKSDILSLTDEGYLQLTRESGLVISEGRYDRDNKTVMSLAITLDGSADISAQKKNASALMQQCIDSELIESIMEYADTKITSLDTIERKDFKSENMRVIVTGYMGPIVLYRYF